LLIYHYLTSVSQVELQYPAVTIAGEVGINCIDIWKELAKSPLSRVTLRGCSSRIQYLQNLIQLHPVDQRRNCATIICGNLQIRYS